MPRTSQEQFGTSSAESVRKPSNLMAAQQRAGRCDDALQTSEAQLLGKRGKELSASFTSLSQVLDQFSRAHTSHWIIIRLPQPKDFTELRPQARCIPGRVIPGWTLHHTTPSGIRTGMYLQSWWFPSSTSKARRDVSSFTHKIQQNRRKHMGMVAFRRNKTEKVERKTSKARCKSLQVHCIFKIEL